MVIGRERKRRPVAWYTTLAMVLVAIETKIEGLTPTRTDPNSNRNSNRARFGRSSCIEVEMTGDVDENRMRRVRLGHSGCGRDPIF